MLVDVHLDVERESCAHQTSTTLSLKSKVFDCYLALTYYGQNLGILVLIELKYNKACRN